MEDANGEFPINNIQITVEALGSILKCHLYQGRMQGSPTTPADLGLGKQAFMVPESVEWRDW